MRPTSVDPVKLTNVHARMIENRCSPAGPIAKDYVQDTRREPSFLHEHLGKMIGGKRCIFRRLKDHRVSLNDEGWPAHFHDGIAMGKFQGVIKPATPAGTRTDIANLLDSSKEWRARAGGGLLQPSDMSCQWLLARRLSLSAMTLPISRTDLARILFFCC